MTDTTEVKPEKWLEEYGDYLYSFAIKKVKQSHIAEDLVQDTLLSALKNHQGFKGESSLKTWLTAILKNKIFDHFKKESRSHLSCDENQFDNEFHNTGIWKVYVADWGRQPDEHLEDKGFLRAFAVCFDKLKPETRELFELKLKSDMDNEEICKVMGISITNLWVLLHRARMQLRDCLNRNWYKNA